MTSGKARWNGTVSRRKNARDARYRRKTRDGLNMQKSNNLLSFVSRLSFKLFWPALIVAFAVALSLILWSGRPEKMSYRAMACAFEERSPSCLDSIRDWHEGLAYFDSSIAATHDTLNSLKSLLWKFWNIEFAGAGEASVAKDAVLPLRVLANRKSGCMGLSWLALMVAESRDLQLGRGMFFCATIPRTDLRIWNLTVEVFLTRTRNIAKSIKMETGPGWSFDR